MKEREGRAGEGGQTTSRAFQLKIVLTRRELRQFLDAAWGNKLITKLPTWQALVGGQEQGALAGSGWAEGGARGLAKFYGHG